MSAGYPDFVTEKAALSEMQLLRSHGNKIAFTNGCFDLLHIGHVELFNTVSEQGHSLFVGVNSDSSVRRLKGPGRPVNPELQRARIVSCIKSVHMAFVFDDLRVDRLIRLFEPDYWVKGGDYKIGTLDKDEVAAAKAAKCEIVLIPIKHRVSTTWILGKSKEKG